MRITQRADYALRAMLDLALHAPVGGGARSSDIAQRTHVPRKFLEAILLELRKAGFVASKRGPDGGHWLARDPARVTVGAILAAIDGPVGGRHGEGLGARHEEPCLQSLWARVDDAVHAVVDGVTLEDLRRDAGARAVLDFNI